MAPRIARLVDDARVGPLLRNRFFYYHGGTERNRLRHGTRQAEGIRGDVLVWGAPLPYHADPQDLVVLPPHVEAASLYLLSLSGWPMDVRSLNSAGDEFVGTVVELNRQILAWGRPAKLGHALAGQGAASLAADLPEAVRQSERHLTHLEVLWMEALQSARSLTKAESDFFGLAV